MGIELQSLPDLRIPTKPDEQITLDGKPLSIANLDTIPQDEERPNLTAAIGVATTLYNWCPDALFAFIDLSSWFSFTWILTIQTGLPEEIRYEIGRIKNVVTMGVLDKDEHWKLMLSFIIAPDSGVWIPNTEESMLEEKDITDSAKIETLAHAFVKNLLLQRAWQTGKKTRHNFFIEFAPMEDAFSDGIAMNPHWLYRGIDLSRCTTCGKREGQGVGLSRCSKCGTAAYCSGVCQREDWAVHKAVCRMTMEDRGKALHLSKDGGLVRWCQASRGEASREDVRGEEGQ